MISFIERKKLTLTNKIISSLIAFTFIFTSVVPPQARAQVAMLPAVGTMITQTNAYTPALINGLRVHADNPLEFNFIVNPGNSGLEGQKLNDEATKLVKYFLAGLTVPEKEMWVNLSPYEKNRIVTKTFGDTEMGRDLLAQDYILKQLTASMMFPEKSLGKAFWERVYKKAMEKYGTTDIPMNTFNKIWIVPQEARIYENGDSAFIIDSHLKVMLEEDYVALNKNLGNKEFGTAGMGEADAKIVSGISSDVVREVLIPEIEKEVNTGKVFANLRQIYNSVILATWYKQNLQKTLLSQIYVNKGKTKGVDTKDKTVNQKIYNQYVEAFKKGVYNYIKEDYDPAKQEVVSRRYFSGGLTIDPSKAMVTFPESKMTEELRARTTGNNSGAFDFDVNLLEKDASKYAPALAAQKANAANSAMMTDTKRKPTEFLKVTDHIPGWKDLTGDKIYLPDNAKIYPATLNFLKYYGGDKAGYKDLRDLADEMGSVSLAIGETKDPYIDIADSQRLITINRDFLGFIRKSGRNKILVSLIAGALLKIKEGADVDPQKITDLEIKIASSKKSLFKQYKSRLDETKALYQIDKKIKNNRTKEGAKDPYFLTDNDITLMISDVLHRGKVLDTRRLKVYLNQLYQFYGDISEERAAKLLEDFYSAHKDIVVKSETEEKVGIEDLLNKLDDNAKIVVDEKDAEEKNKTVTLYGLNPEYTADPAYKGRATIWDVEVERQDEVNFGGKSAHTGAMLQIPKVVELPNFFTNGDTFQNLFKSNTFDKFSPVLNQRIKELTAFRDTMRDELNGVMSDDLSKDIEDQLNDLRVVIEDSNKVSVIEQINKAIQVMNELKAEIESGKYQDLKDYFIKTGESLDKEFFYIKKQKAEFQIGMEKVRKELSAIEAIDKKIDEKSNILNKTKGEKNIEEIKAQISDLKKSLPENKEEIVSKLTSKINEYKTKLADIQFRKEDVSAKVADKLLVAARNMVLSDALTKEIKDDLRALAKRLNIPLNKLVLAIRSSAVGEDSETASFAGRQDTYIFQTPVSTASDPEGLDALINSWVFNQASLFNKRAIDYRFDQELPTFDDKVEISTLFQTMFLTEYSFIGFSIDRETSFPSLSSQWTEGQGELLVSGKESGSKYIMSYDGTLLVRAKGERAFKIVETPDGLGKVKLPLTDKEKAEFAITDKDLLKQISEYFMAFHKYYEGFVDLEGGIRRLRDTENNILYHADPITGEPLKDERGFNRPKWGIASTQVRPETVFSGQDLNVVPLRRVVVTEKAFKKAEAEGRVLPFNFIAKTGGTSQGPVKWVLDKKPESLAGTSGHIMFAIQSDPDMNTAMIEARGIAAQLGGPNSHTMIVASEYNLIAATGIPKYSLEEIMSLIPEGTEITLDAERGKIILGMDHELAVEGSDFNVMDIPDTEFNTIRSSTIVASPSKAFKQWALSKIPTYKGIGLKRLELALTDAIGIYPDDLLRYDYLIQKEAGQKVEGKPLERGFSLDTLKAYTKKVKIDKKVISDLESALYENDLTKDDISAYLNMRDIEKDSNFKSNGKVLDRKKDKKLIERIEQRIIKDTEVIEFVEEKISGYNSGRDFYVSVLSEWLQATAESLIAPKNEVLTRAQKISDPDLRLKVWDIVDDFYKVGLGEKEPLYKLKDLFDSIHKFGDAIKEGSDADILSKVIGLVDKTLFIRMDDRKSDEYDAVPGADRYVKREVNPMKGKRGLDLMFENEETLRWQLDAIKKVAESKKIQIGVFAPVVRRPGDIVELRRVMDKYGLTKDLVKRGIMTELPTNSINVDDYLDALDDNGFFSTGGNDGLQTLLRVDRNTSNDDLQKAVTAYNISVLRWNANLARAVKEYNERTGKHIAIGFCGNDPSVHPDYGVILQRMGYDSVSVTIGSYEKVANNLTRSDLEILPAALEAIGYKYDDFVKDAYKYIKEINYSRINVGDIRSQRLGIHYKALAEYDAVLSARSKGNEVEMKGEHLKAYMIVRKLLEEKGYKDQLDEPGVGMKYYADTVKKNFEQEVKKAKDEGKKIVIGTDDIMSRQYYNLPLGTRYERKEANPDFGVHGLNKAIHGDAAFTKKDFEIIKALSDKYGNVELGLNVVRTYQEIGQTRKIMSAVGLDVPIVVDVEVPGDTFQMDKILSPGNRVSAVSVSNPLRFVSDLMNLEQNNINGLPITYKDIQYQLQRPIKKLATEAKRAGVPLYVDQMISDIFESQEKASPAVESQKTTDKTVEPAETENKDLKRPDILKIGVLTGGGLASGHNSLIAAMVREAQKEGKNVQIIGIKKGWAGLIEDDLIEQADVVTPDEADFYSGTGGSMLKSSRTNPFSEENVRKGIPEKIMDNIKKLGLDALVTCGGDDTSGAAAKLQTKYPDFPILAVPKTMDNDIVLPDMVPTYGYDTFVKEGARIAELYKKSAIDQERGLIVEVFGRDSGFTALGIGAEVGATRSLIPEEGFIDFNKLISQVQSFYDQHKYALVIVSEGAKIKIDSSNYALFEQAFKKSPVAKAIFERTDLKTDEFGHPKLKDAGRIIAALLNGQIIDKDSGKEVTITLPGKIDYAPREGDTSDADLIMTEKIGTAAVKFLREKGLQNQILYVNLNGDVKGMDLQKDLGGRVADIKGEQKVNQKDLYVFANRAIFPTIDYDISLLMAVSKGDALSKEAIKSLDKNKILTVKDLIKLTEGDLYKMGLGSKDVRALKFALWSLEHHLTNGNILTRDKAMLPRPLDGKTAFEALETTAAGREAVIMATNIRSPLSIPGIMKAALETRSIVLFQQAMSELGYTWPNGYSLENPKKLAEMVNTVGKQFGYDGYLLKADHVTVKVDDKFLADKDAQLAIEKLFDKILAEKDIAKREAIFMAAMEDELLNANPNVKKALGAIMKAYQLVKAQVEAGASVFALDASFMPMPLNVRITAFLDGIIPETASHEAEVGEIGGSQNSTIADALEFVTGFRYEERILTDEGGAVYSELVLDDQGKPKVISRGKGLLDYGVKISRLALNNGTSHGNNYDKDGNLIVTKMNLKATEAITAALAPYGIKIVQHGITGTPLENLPALRAAGITSGHVGTNWQNIIWEVLTELAKTNEIAANLVNSMIDTLVTKYGTKYNVENRLTAEPKDLQKLIGKELKNIMGEYQGQMLALPQDIKDQITQKTYESALAHFKAFKSVGTYDIVKNYMEKADEARASFGAPQMGGTVSTPGSLQSPELKGEKIDKAMLNAIQAKNIQAKEQVLDANGNPVGGINLDPAMLNLKIKRDSNWVPLPMTQYEIKNLNIEGFIPVIINVTPVINLPMLLGFAVDENDNSEKKADAGSSSFGPMDRKAKVEAVDYNLES